MLSGRAVDALRFQIYTHTVAVETGGVGAGGGLFGMRVERALNTRITIIIINYVYKPKLHARGAHTQRVCVATHRGVVVRNEGHMD